jgi:hypothetical protein
MDIGYVTVIYFIIGLLASRLFDKYFGLFDSKNEDKKSIYHVGLELIGMIWLIGISTYVVRNLAELIPSPFDGLYGFQHRRVKELSSAAGYTLIVMGYAYHLRAKLEYYNKRLNKYLDSKLIPEISNKIKKFSERSKNIGDKTVLIDPQTIDNK